MDLFDILKDPDFASVCTLISIARTVDDQGRNQESDQRQDIEAAIQPASPKEIETLPEAERTRSTIAVWSMAPLDLGGKISWRGDLYKIASVNIWDGFGDRLFHALAIKENVA